MDMDFKWLMFLTLKALLGVVLAQFLINSLCARSKTILMLIIQSLEPQHNKINISMVWSVIIVLISQFQLKENSNVLVQLKWPLCKIMI